jgi:uncharacterized protein (DUF1015 family)
MPDIQAFRGYRYDLGHVGCLSDVVAPPYDVIDERLHDELYKRHPANFVRLILNREEPGDDDSQTRYSRAARIWKNWTSEGVLSREPDPAIYVYHQQFEHHGQVYVRRGMLAAVALEPFGEGTIFPHEETHPGPKKDRLQLLRAVRVKLSPIFGVYPDDDNVCQDQLESAIAGKIPLEATDHEGVVHRLWPVTDVKVIADVAAAMSGRPVFVADGHHRYETACTYRDELGAAGRLHPTHPARRTLMMCVGMSDPGMLVLPTHRLFRGLPEMTSGDLAARLGDCFTLEKAGVGPDLAPSLWERIETEGEQGTLALYTHADRHWMIARITDAGRARLEEVASGHSPEWCGLGVSILHRLIVDTLLDAPDLPKPMYVRGEHEVAGFLEKGDSTGRDATGQQGEGGAFHLAALVMPASLDHVRLISEAHERMPAKSTFFYPKALSGLVAYPLS